MGWVQQGKLLLEIPGSAEQILDIDAALSPPPWRTLLRPTLTTDRLGNHSGSAFKLDDEEAAIPGSVQPSCSCEDVALLR